MKVKKILELIDSAKPNEISESVKLTWLNDVEAKVACEIFKTAPEEYVSFEDVESELSVPEAYSGMYLLYVLAMLELSSGGYSDYVKIKDCFESEFRAYARQVIKTR